MAGKIRTRLTRGARAVIAGAILSLISPSVRAAEVAFDGSESAGTIVVRTNERMLYLALGKGRALSYPVGVGRAGRQWSGNTSIGGKFVLPNWAPPDEIRRDRPGLPELIAGGAANNPMGAAALTLLGGSYAIHGTNQPDSIGGFVSYGCIRMHNADITDLYSRVRVGTKVVVVLR